MSGNQFVVTDIDFENLNEVSMAKSLCAETIVKEENVRDDDILLFTEADIADFGGAANNFEIVDNVGHTVAIPENSAFNIPFSDEQLNHLVNTNSFAPKLSFEIFGTKVGTVKSEGNYSHLVKYKVQDGKHTKVWQCGICSKEFGHQYILMRHLPTHTDERKFQCNICGKAFRQMSTLSQHRAIHSAERPYICEICQKTFNRVSTLISHRKTHTGHKPHRCHLCNKAFHQKGNLRNHIFTHTNERPYKCDVCAKGFNQMSNLMCHKLKAHQRADKPRYTCQSCGKEFQKRMGLRNHEQYEHGDMNGASSSNGVPRIRYTNGVLVDPINTAAMQHALATNQIPFALLRPLNGIPVLVRVLAAGDKQMLVPATAEDLKKHGQITITPKGEDEGKADDESKDPRGGQSSAVIDSGKPSGSTVQIKIPVVATVIQRCGKDGNMCMDVESPGPSSGGLMQDSYLVTTSNPNSQQDASQTDRSDMEMDVTGNVTMHGGDMATGNAIEYFDLSENVMDEPDKQRNFPQNFSFGSGVFSGNLHFGGLDENRENMEPSAIYPDDIFDLQGGGDASTTHVFQILEKPTTINITDNVLDGSSALYDAANLNQQFL